MTARERLEKIINAFEAKPGSLPVPEIHRFFHAKSRDYRPNQDSLMTNETAATPPLVT